MEGGTPRNAAHDASDIRRAFWHGRSVLVTGATGFIGSELCVTLLSFGARVSGLDRNWDPNDPLRLERINRMVGRSTFTPVACDLRDALATEAAIRENQGSTVFHLAARPGVRDPSLAEVFADNVAATEQLFALFRSYPPAQVIFASSSSVYGEAAALPFVESGPIGGLSSPYARSKLLGEVAAAALHRELRCPVTVARLFNVYGARGRPDMAPGVFLRCILTGERLVLAADGEVERDLTHVDDTVGGLVRLAEHAAKSATLTTVNLGTGKRTSMRTLLSCLEEAAGRRATTTPGPLKAGDLPATQADTSLLRALVGWQPGVGLDSGITRFTRWALSHTSYVGTNGPVQRAQGSTAPGVEVSESEPTLPRHSLSGARVQLGPPARAADS